MTVPKVCVLMTGQSAAMTLDKPKSEIWGAQVYVCACVCIYVCVCVCVCVRFNDGAVCCDDPRQAKIRNLGCASVCLCHVCVCVCVCVLMTGQSAAMTLDKPKS